MHAGTVKALWFWFLSTLRFVVRTGDFDDCERKKSFRNGGCTGCGDGDWGWNWRCTGCGECEWRGCGDGDDGREPDSDDYS
jgi:hypothetical protein